MLLAENLSEGIPGVVRHSSLRSVEISNIQSLVIASSLVIFFNPGTRCPTSNIRGLTKASVDPDRRPGDLALINRLT
jgi:hypothetical protein